VQHVTGHYNKNWQMNACRQHLKVGFFQQDVCMLSRYMQSM